MRRHWLTLQDGYREFAELGFNRGARLLIQPSAEGLLNTGEVFGLMLPGLDFEPATPGRAGTALSVEPDRFRDA